MAERRDNKGRKLLSGELQRSNGRYEYRYSDSKGKRHSVYSWRLVESDKPPKGKATSPALRTLEKSITKDLVDGIDTHSAKSVTLNSYFDIYINTKVGLKQSTKTNYIYMYNKFVRDSVGKMAIGDIKYTTMMNFYIGLISGGTFKINSLDTIQCIVHPVFTLAVKDEVIRHNPTDGLVAELKKNNKWQRTKRHALTIPQQEAFINYYSDVYPREVNDLLPLFTVMLGTGMRVGETVGLTWDDCDFEHNCIYVNHNLIYRQQLTGKCEFHVTKPKTTAGERVIPMLADVRRALLTQYNNDLINKGFCRAEIDGVSGFVFHNRFGDPMSPHNINRVIERVSKAYNQREVDNAILENRSPVILPHFTCHNLRHTFCTRFCENDTNLKAIQEIMGHASIETTMNTYNEATAEIKKSSMANLEGKIKIS